MPTHTLLVPRPRLGFLNLVGANAEPAAAEDLKSFEALFGKPVAAAPGEIPACDVLFLYCELERAGTLRDRPQPLAELLRASRAKVAVVAWNNAGDAYYAATKRGDVGCSLVQTTDRRGPRFGSFLKRVFAEMFAGTPMPAAWKKFAPEVPDTRADAPGAIFTPGTAAVAFTF